MPPKGGTLQDKAQKLANSIPGPVEKAKAEVNAAGKTMEDITGDELKQLLSPATFASLMSCMRTNIKVLNTNGQPAPFQEYTQSTDDKSRRDIARKFCIDPSLGTFKAKETISLVQDELTTDSTTYKTLGWFAGPNGFNDQTIAEASKFWARSQGRVCWSASHVMLDSCWDTVPSQMLLLGHATICMMRPLTPQL